MNHGYKIMDCPHPLADDADFQIDEVDLVLWINLPARRRELVVLVAMVEMLCERIGEINENGPPERQAQAAKGAV